MTAQGMDYTPFTPIICGGRMREVVMCDIAENARICRWETYIDGSYEQYVKRLPYGSPGITDQALKDAREEALRVFKSVENAQAA